MSKNGCYGSVIGHSLLVVLGGVDLVPEHQDCLLGVVGGLILNKCGHSVARLSLGCHFCDSVLDVAKESAA